MQRRGPKRATLQQQNRLLALVEYRRQVSLLIANFNRENLLETRNEINGPDQLLRIALPSEQPFDLKFTSREVTAWGGLALLKRMLDGLDFKAALQSWDLPPPGCHLGTPL
jgi:hypothetical protein